MIHLQHESNSWSKNNKKAKQSFSFSKEIKYLVFKEFLNILADHYEFFKKILMIPQKPVLILHKIKQKMCSNFKGLHSFSLETLRFTLRNKVGASYRLINKINLKLAKPQNVI